MDFRHDRVTIDERTYDVPSLSAMRTVRDLLSFLLKEPLCPWSGLRFGVDEIYLATAEGFPLQPDVELHTLRDRGALTMFC